MWQPIETFHRKENVEILVVAEDGYPEIVTWNKKRGHFVTADQRAFAMVKGWMPIPDIPDEWRD